MPWVEQPLTEELLDLILMVQARLKAAMSYNMFCSSSKTGTPIDAVKDAERLYYRTSREVLQRNKLSANRDNFEAILDFEVTDEMRRCQFPELPRRFTFRFFNTRRD